MTDDLRADAPRRGSSDHLGAILGVYLMGLLIGGLYVGMVAPVRTVIQVDFGLSDAEGIWMINIYTLFYAALIPVIGKMADRYGRKRVFMACFAVFCIGALMCGLSGEFGGFALLLVGRVVQAVGACGMIPVANAELGTSFPPERRGMALGMAAGVTGIANMLGAAVGSAILGFVGPENWEWLFYVCIPLGLLTIAAAAFFLPNRTVETHGRLDYLGSLLMVVGILLLLSGLREVDFLNLAAAAGNWQLWAYLGGAVVVFVAFGFVERRASDPVFRLEYLHSRPIVITMLVSFFVGCIIVSMTLIPEFAELAMGNPVGSGGYYVVAIGMASLIGPPLGGKLIDRFGPKPVLAFGLIVGALGYAFLALVVVPAPNHVMLVVGLAIVGLGMGFAMGAPTNYMILENTDAADSASAIATITLVRQAGTTLAPALFVGFTTGGTGLDGYAYMLLAVAACAVLALLCLAFYRPRAPLAD